MVVVEEEENSKILWPEFLYKCATFYLLLSLHSALEELTWVGSVLSAKNSLVVRIVCKGTWCLNTAMLVSPHFKQFQCLHRNVSGFVSSILSPPWLPEWPGPEKRPGFDLCCNKLQRQFTLPRRGSFGVRDGPLEKWWWVGGWGWEFSACTIFFFRLLLVQEFFFQVNPSARIFSSDKYCFFLNSEILIYYLCFCAL